MQVIAGGIMYHVIICHSLSASRTQHYDVKQTRVYSNAQPERRRPSTTLTRTTIILTVKSLILLKSRILIERFAVSDSHDLRLLER